MDSTTAATARLTPEDLALIAQAAHRAPSLHNTQPWRFRALLDGLEIHEDTDRALPVVDPFGRDRLISCGTAAYNAALAVGHLGWTPQLALCPDPGNPRLLATVTCGPRRRPDAEDEQLYEAIPHRRTHRRVFLPTAVDDDRLEELRGAVAAHGAWLHVVDARRRDRLADLLWRAAREQAESREFRREIGRWLRETGEGVDGVPVASLGKAPYPVDGLVTHDLPLRRDAEDWIAEELTHSTVLVLFTLGDDPLDWLRAGMALEHLLLRATLDGLVASFADQPLQQTRLRPELAAFLDEPGHPQAIIRIGRPMVTVPPTPRRPLDQVFMN
jgi:hypothetical protein